MSMHAPTVLVMAGGTGGHVFPALATAHELQQAGYRIEWLGTAAGIEAELVPANDILLHRISVAGLRGKGKLGLLLAPFKLLRATWQALAVIRRVKPVCVLGMGGFASGPGGLAAWLQRVPLLIHEQNAIPGMTNRVLSRLATRVMEAFPGAFEASARALATGNPIRSSIMALPAPAERFAGRNGPLKLLVVGGSLGAKAINDCVPETLAALEPEQRPEVWHQTGKRNLDETQTRYRELGVEARVVPFIDDMDAAYGWADLVLCRSGALTVSELAAAGVPSLLVPFPFAVDDHQTANARYLADAGAAVLLPQPQLNVQRLSALLNQYNDRDRLLAMAGKARELAHPQATATVAQQCRECAGES
ncbi:undecaprenyldiphospho-muramoylpentapeptide beta-N-acetylglucosaminyltransferase [Motiliproteus sediminis]|uniref:undecaprenyldiphospho-muramoylpentapeptide beta-N-acetylglucosaminyltransferase n=1 Tax=Motiliproteus sediminis TaxID=1468178 RepID=UPI001AEFB1AA|nr:undecaprenyldiphospho-muramoylpentapeptide beta-N-acetylglucosaminyltransferase [Motiliproteus sediminis]